MSKELNQHLEQAEGAQEERCPSCDGTGDLTRQDGEWMGYCVCAEGEALKNRAALAQPSPKCATCNDRGHVCLDWEAGAWDECPDCKAQEPQNCPTFMGEPIAQPYEAPRDKINALFKALGFSGTASVGDILDAAIERVQAQPSPSVVQLSGSRERRIYVAGPMTGYKDFNFPAFNAQAEALRGLGYHVENPAEHGIVDGAEWQDYLRYDIGRLSTCEAIFLLPGWSKSKGAALEVHIAKALGMTFIHHADAEHEQPSPAPELEQVERFEPAHGTDRGGNVFAYMIDNEAGEYMEFAQHDRIVGALQAELASTTDASNRYNNLWNSAGNRLALAQVEIRKLTSERDAAQAKLAELEKQEPVYTKPSWADNYGWGGGHIDFKCAWEVEKLARHFEELLDAVPEGPLYAAPVAQAGQVPEKPTEAMLQAGMNAMAEAQRNGSQSLYAYAGVCWDAMLAAAPQPAKGGDGIDHTWCDGVCDD